MKVACKGRKMFVVLMAACLVAGVAAGAFGAGGFPEPGGCLAENLAPIPHTGIKVQLFVANAIDQFGLFGGVGTQPDGTPAAPVLGVDVFVQGKCSKKKISPSRVNMPFMMINSATAPDHLVGLIIDKILMDPDVETTCFDPATLASTPLVGYALQSVDDFSKRGYFLSFNDPFTGLIVPVKDYAIETEAKVVGLYCKP